MHSVSSRWPRIGGQELGAASHADSSAALAIAKRKGAGKMRHINVSALWIPDVQDREGAQYLNIEGTHIGRCDGQISDKSRSPKKDEPALDWAFKGPRPIRFSLIEVETP